MQFSQMASNPLVQSIVHASFKRSIKELGLPDFSQERFSTEIPAFLRLPNSLFEDTPETRQKLWSAVMHGEVIAAEIKDNLACVFYVRGYVGSRGIDIRLVCESHGWHIDKVISMYTKKVAGTRWFRRSVFTGAVIVAGLLGYMVHGSQPAVSTGLTGSYSSAQGSARTVPQSVSASKQPSNSSNRTGSKDKPQAATTKQQTSSKPAVQTLSFTLTEGMPLDDLSQFLKSHHLIQSAVSFDMLMKNTQADRDVRPGTYHFTTNMTQQQLIQTLKQGPSTP